MEENLTQKAVDLAIKCNWTEAIKINLKILKSNSDDIEALNRLSRSYYENGNTVNAKKTSLKVIKTGYLNRDDFRSSRPIFYKINIKRLSELFEKTLFYQAAYAYEGALVKSDYKIPLPAELRLNYKKKDNVKT